MLSSFKCPTSQIRKDAEAKREAKVGLAPIQNMITMFTHVIVYAIVNLDFT